MQNVKMQDVHHAPDGSAENLLQHSGSAQQANSGFSRASLPAFRTRLAFRARLETRFLRPGRCFPLSAQMFSFFLPISSLRIREMVREAAASKSAFSHARVVAWCPRGLKIQKNIAHTSACYNRLNVRPCVQCLRGGCPPRRSMFTQLSP